MRYINFRKLFKKYIDQWNGITIEDDLSVYHNILQIIKQYALQNNDKSDAELRGISNRLLQRAQSGEAIDNLLAEAYGLILATIPRVLNLKPFDLQVIGGIVLHQGKLLEMPTGEGKTLTAVFPAYLNALLKKGIHILTFNDYLARRDAEWMGPIFTFLGLEVGFILEGMTTHERQKAYRADICYLTAKEAGFDFLRDSLINHPRESVQRDFHYAIVDEADSILIDEARIPLVIAGSADEYIADIHRVARIAHKLQIHADFDFDEYGRNVHLNETGIHRAETLLNCANLFATENTDLLTRLNCALHAEHLLQRDIDYIVRNNKIELVDEFTGRVADKRRWQDGLQAALEAKEQLPLQSKGQVLNSITLQHFLQFYPKICGMTATAVSSEREFREFYGLHMVVLPSNKPCIRIDHPDRVFPDKKAKHKAIIAEIRKVHRSGRPILLGTRSVEESADIAKKLEIIGVSCRILNARNDTMEASIIAEAGSLGAVTISTNMAGRGTDIRLGGTEERERDKVIALGGLYVIGTNRHESLRIDRQLRGRAGRQGDPGSSRFFISLEDDLFVKYRLQELLPHRFQFDPQTHEMENPVLCREIDRIQRIIDGQHLEIKKTLLQYSSILETQRKIVAQERSEILNSARETDFYQNHCPEKFRQIQAGLNQEIIDESCRLISLWQIDRLWSQYLAEINDIRDGIHLKRLGRQLPLLEYSKIAIELFDQYRDSFDDERITAIENIHISSDSHLDINSQLKTPSATWTYLINDNPFEETLGLQLMGDMGMSIAAGIAGPLLAVYWLWKRLARSFGRNRTEL